ncbi:hypothetical protein ACE6ED_26660 [Paenibacillus sp. CN-4]|uniref:hypothetical protein n=1 Tax=Paenibacillus nanchangensis TaxID=3348343 RepID=UPI00397A6121
MGYTLSNGVLTVEINDEEAAKGTRFDRTGFITQVTLHPGNHTFCVPESYTEGEGTGGSGLCNEFGISRTIGYDEAAPGEWFPKLGVGLLQRKGEEPYFFADRYPEQPFQVRVNVTAEEVNYEAEPADCRGYSARLQKTIRLLENRLIINYTLTNTGVKPIETEEYVHNFVGINGAKVGKTYELMFPGPAEVSAPESAYTEQLLQAEDNRISWTAEPDRQFYCLLKGCDAEAQAYRWKLVHKPTGASVSESGSFPVAKAALWGDRHVISPEIFIQLSVQPGENASWWREYCFEA